MGLAHAISTGADPLTADVGIVWADPATRSVAQEADSVVKLFTAGLLPASTALERLGYTETQIAQIRSERRSDALDVAGTDLVGLMSQ